MVIRPSELRNFLEEWGIDPKKGLSQNFLIDRNVLGKICVAAEVVSGDHILEIGPGPGALTEALLERGAHVVAIEKDRDFAKALERLKPRGNLTVIEGDILEFSLASLLNSGTTWKVVANLPYHITTPILVKLVPLFKEISSLTVMVQKEVAKRFAAEKNTSEYGSITLFLEFYSTISYCFTVEPTCFYPQPKVQSAVVRCDLKPPPDVASEAFFKLTRTAFQKRRKMLRASLKELYPSTQVEEALIGIGLSKEARPEMLSLRDFLRLFEQLSK
jgi:16S rRNA (adenine1518-N6/adenine1519-N6)-dimethyltransferase